MVLLNNPEHLIETVNSRRFSIVICYGRKERKMKKRITLLASVVLVCTLLLPMSVSACPIDDETMGYCCDAADIEKNDELLLDLHDSDIISEQGTVSRATCKHTYSSWITTHEKYEAGALMDCNILVQLQTRYCTKCNAAFVREKRTQLPHALIWNGNLCRCKVCGKSFGYLSL